MRLLIVSGDATVAAGRNSTFRSVLETFREGWERIDVITPPTNAAEPVTNFGNVFIHPMPVGTNKLAQYRWIIANVISLVREHQHDLVSTTAYGTCLLARATTRAVERMSHRPRFMLEVFHVAGVPRAGGLRDHIERVFVTAFLRGPARKADAIRVMNTNEMPPYLQRCGLAPSRFVLIPAVFYDPADYATVDSEPKRYDLMFCGRLMPNKGVDLLLATFEQVRRQRPSTTLLIKASGGIQRRWLEQQIARLHAQEHITIIDWVETPADLVQLYAQARVLLCTSYNEGGPRVTVEAMVCGTPVVSTRVGIMPDLIEHGTNGFLSDWDADEMATYCLQLLADEDLAQRIGEAGAVTARPLTRERVIGHYIDAYHGVARQD